MLQPDRVPRPKILDLPGGSLLDAPQIRAVAYLVQTFGPIDANAARAHFIREFPGVRLPKANFQTLISQALQQGLVTKVWRGVYR